MGNLHYIVTSCKNTGATYQVAMIAIFHYKLHDCQEDYFDDIVVKVHNNLNNRRKSFKDANVINSK